jgi:hypothetical protein
MVLTKTHLQLIQSELVTHEEKTMTNEYLIFLQFKMCKRNRTSKAYTAKTRYCPFLASTKEQIDSRFRLFYSTSKKEFETQINKLESVELYTLILINMGKFIPIKVVKENPANLFLPIMRYHNPPRNFYPFAVMPTREIAEMCIARTQSDFKTIEFENPQILHFQ